jgi:hypothetical protein
MASIDGAELSSPKDHVDAIIADCRTSGVGLIELMSNHAEPVTEYQAQVAAARVARSAAATAAAASGTHSQHVAQHPLAAP